MGWWGGGVVRTCCQRVITSHSNMKSLRIVIIITVVDSMHQTFDSHFISLLFDSGYESDFLKNDPFLSLSDPTPPKTAFHSCSSTSTVHLPIRFIHKGYNFNFTETMVSILSSQPWIKKSFINVKYFYVYFKQSAEDDKTSLQQAVQHVTIKPKHLLIRFKHIIPTVKHITYVKIANNATIQILQELF